MTAAEFILLFALDKDTNKDNTKYFRDYRESGNDFPWGYAPVNSKAFAEQFNDVVRIVDAFDEVENVFVIQDNTLLFAPWVSEEYRDYLSTKIKRDWKHELWLTP